jgi:MFS family permease
MFAYRTMLQEQARPAVIRASRRAPWLAVGVVCFGAFMGQLDASIVTITFPAMERDFSVPVAAIQWVSLIYLLGLIALLAPAGRLGDTVGRKLVYTYGFAVFTLASAACGLAPSLGVLVVLRLVQAAGAAMLQSNSVALVTTSAPKPKMRFALGVQAGAQSIGLALGPTLGGLLTSTVGWRAVYWVNVPFGVAAIVAGRYLLPRTRQFSPREKFDWPGTFLLVGWTSASLLVLSAASGLSLPPWIAALLGAFGIAGVAAFIRREITTSHPLIPLWLLRSRPMALALTGAACGYLTLFGPLVLIPQVLGHGLGEARIGLLLSALPLGFGLAALFGDAMLPHGWGNRQRGFAGAFLTCVVMSAAVVTPVTGSTVVPLLALAGLGLGIFVPANNTVIMRSTADSSASLLGGLVNMARGIGTTLGISLMALALHLGNPGNFPNASHGYAESAQARPAFIVLAVVSAAAAAIALAGRAQPRGSRRLREAGPSSV